MSMPPDLQNVPSRFSEQVARYWEQFASAAQAQGVACEPGALDTVKLSAVWAASDFVAQSCIRSPELLADLLESGDLNRAYDPHFYAGSLATRLHDVTDETLLGAQLRRFRRREMVRIAWRDLAGFADLVETLADLSALANACLDQALAWLAPRHSQLWGGPQGRHSAHPQGLVVIGMGKLGAGELNFSSDVDVIFAYDEDGQTQGGAKGPVSNQEYFTSLARRLIQAIHAPTEDGFVFRVDTRLRPFGDSGPLVMSFDAMEEYYQAHGREWERYAWIKAAVVAGDRSAGERLMELLRPFVFRRYLDFGAFESLRDMKVLIEAEVKRKSMADNIKLGAGGIREIEFIGQAFQLIRGGREIELQQRPILPVLQCLVESDYLPAYVGAELAEAYRFLRRAENRLQEYADQQTHRLPDDDLDRERLAMAMGYGDWSGFKGDLDRHRRRVQGHFEQVFAAPQTEDSGQNEADGLAQVWAGLLTADVAVTRLVDAGYAHGEETLNLIVRFRESATCRQLSAPGRARLNHLMPLLLGAASASEQPDAVLARLLDLLDKIARRITYLALLAESPLALSQLVQLCAASPWIAALLTRHPLLLDELLDPRALYAPLKRAALETELADELAGVDDEDLERQMETLRHFQQANMLRVAAADVAGAYHLMVVSDHLTEVAEVVVGAALRMAYQHLMARHGEPRCRIDGKEVEPGFVIIGYGKLGGIELGYGSDLDLVFLHGSAGEEMGTQGEKPVDNNVFFARLGQRIIHMLTAHTPEGVLYEVDMRLRPNGASGMLVSSMSAFEQYQRHDAWTWEHQALVRARVIAGDAEVAAGFNAIRREVLARPRDATQLRQEVREMRERMRAELGQRRSERFDLKQDAGGIADIEFMVQYGVLAWTYQHPSLLRYTDNIRLLEGFAREELLDAQDAALLSDIYRTYRAKVHQLTLLKEPTVVDASEYVDERAAVLRLWGSLLESDGADV